MSIATVQRGSKSFREAEFGSGDIIIMKARETTEHPYDNMIILADDGNPHEIGADSGYAQTNTDQIPMVGDPISLKFNKSTSVRVLIEDLLEIEQNLIADGK
ncbi:hypothetical protein [Spirosoma litoris]